MTGNNNNTSSTISSSGAQSNSKAAPIACMLCRRQFGSQELLLRHERESQLHAENLAKKHAAEAVLKNAEDKEPDENSSTTSSSAAATTVVSTSNVIIGSSGTIYKDRAAER